MTDSLPHAKAAKYQSQLETRRTIDEHRHRPDTLRLKAPYQLRNVRLVRNHLPGYHEGVRRGSSVMLYLDSLKGFSFDFQSNIMRCQQPPSDQTAERAACAEVSGQARACLRYNSTATVGAAGSWTGPLREYHRRYAAGPGRVPS